RLSTAALCVAPSSPSIQIRTFRIESFTPLAPPYLTTTLRSLLCLPILSFATAQFRARRERILGVVTAICALRYQRMELLVPMGFRVLAAHDVFSLPVVVAFRVSPEWAVLSLIRTQAT